MALGFDVWEVNISADNIVIPSYIHCISYKWADEKKIHTISQRDFPLFKKDIHNDYEVLKAFSKVISEADVIVAHNGDRFDFRKLNARLLIQGFPPIPETKTIDTFKIAKRYFKLDFNGLDYLAKTLGYKGKMDNPKGLWKDCFFGDVKALKHMEKYNRQDIEILEFVYKKLMPYVKYPLLRKNDEERCQNPACGSTQIEFRGYSSNLRGDKFHRLKCKLCGSWGSVKLNTAP